MDMLVSIVESLLTSDILLYVGLLVDGIISIFLFKKQSKTTSKPTATEQDIQALIEYHEKVVAKLKEKFKK